MSMARPREFSSEYPIDPLLELDAPLPPPSYISLPPPPKQDLPPLPHSPEKLPPELPELPDDFNPPDYGFGLPALSLPRPPLFQPRKIRRTSPERSNDSLIDPSLTTRVGSLSLDNAPSLPPPPPCRNPPRRRSPRISPTLPTTEAPIKRPRGSPTRKPNNSPPGFDSDDSNDSDPAYKPDASPASEPDEPSEPDEQEAADTISKPLNRKTSRTKPPTSYAHRIAIRSLSADHTQCITAFEKLQSPSSPSKKQPRPRPHRFLCYIQGCARNMSTKDEMVRHFSIKRPDEGMHPDEEWDSSKVFKVPYEDWLGDEGLKATAMATCPEEWVKMRYSEWADEEVQRYLKEHKPYEGTGREDRKK